MVNEFLVCEAELNWPRLYRPVGERFYYIMDGDRDLCSRAKCTTMEDIADHLVEGVLLSKTLSSGDMILYNPTFLSDCRSAECFLYKGPALVDAYYYKPLDVEKRAVLENSLERMGMKCRKLKDPDKVVVKKLKRIR
ncbi:MAG: hypothetical protein V1818_01740 [Candidatus Aenigmatarchaeota archaeon]